MRLRHLSSASKRAYFLVLAAITLQATIGIHAVWFPEPIWISNIHQAGALTVLTAVLYALHTCRKVDPRHIRNMLGKLKIENP